jgi:hypothetical protein
MARDTIAIIRVIQHLTDAKRIEIAPHIAPAPSARSRRPEPREWPDVSACEHEMLVAVHSKDFPPPKILCAECSLV